VPDFTLKNGCTVKISTTKKRSQYISRPFLPGNAKKTAGRWSGLPEGVVKGFLNSYLSRKNGPLTLHHELRGAAEHHLEYL
jgi:hypothetical protein